MSSSKIQQAVLCAVFILIGMLFSEGDIVRAIILLIGAFLVQVSLLAALTP